MHRLFDELDYEIDEILEIEDLGIIEEEVYDIGMKETPHTFFANDLLVHNSLFCTVEPILKKFHPEINLDYKTNLSQELLDNEYIKFENWDGHYDSWIREFVNEGVRNNFFSDNVDLDLDKGIITDNINNIEIPFYKLQSFIKSNYTPKTAMAENIVIDKTIHYAQKVQSFINKSYDLYVKRFHNTSSRDHFLDIKQEYVCKSAVWIAKKRYAQWVVDNEGVPVNKLDVKGLDVVRSSFPKAFKKFMNQFIVDILNNKSQKDITNTIKNFKKEMPNLDLISVMSSTGVNNLKEYASKTKGIPIHVRSALNYNKMLKLFKDKDTIPIVSSDKIKWVYLNEKNRYRFPAIALKGFDDNEKIVTFVKNNINYELIYEKALDSKLQDFYTAIGWGTIKSNLVKGKMNKFFKTK